MAKIFGDDDFTEFTRSHAAGNMARTCMALDAAGVPLALASVPGQTMLLFPASLAGRALAALHQAGIDRITI
jgi:hypothetical protein